MDKTKLYILEKDLGEDETGKSTTRLTYVKASKDELIDAFTKLEHIRNSVHSIPVFKDPN